MIQMEKSATRDGFGIGLVELGRKNKNVVVVDADLGKSTKSSLFTKEFPERSFSVGISEADMVLVSCGLAASGKIPFANTFSIFMERAFEQIRNGVCRMNLNVKLIGSHAGMITGEDGSSAQCIEDIAVFRSIPNMVVICPSDAIEAQKATFAIAEYFGPVYMRLAREKVPTIHNSDYIFEIGKGQILKDGTDVTIVACGPQVNESLIAAEKLQAQGINARIINMPTIKPLDFNLIIKAAKETGAIVTAEDHSIIGGLGGAVSECLTANHPIILERVGMLDSFGESGKPQELYEKYGLNANGIIKAVKIAHKRKLMVNHIN